MMMSAISEGKPIKRNENIRPLSREHHFGLLFCWKIRKGLSNGTDPQRMTRYLVYFWEEHLKEHFKLEEDLLFKRVQGVLCTQALNEHLELQKIIGQLLNGTAYHSSDLLEQLIELLARHIRFEERVLFPFLEQSLDADQLREIGGNLQVLHSDEKKDDYADEFWVDSE
jgi:hemerythrin-like domain-containing protein